MIRKNAECFLFLLAFCHCACSECSDRTDESIVSEPKATPARAKSPNLPEETVWYKYRQTGQWTAVSLLLLFGHFVVPFLAMMSRHPKRRRITLAVASVWLLVMHWVDMIWLVFPHVEEYAGRVPFGVPEIASFVGIGGIFVAVLLWRLGRQPLVALRDPRLQEALEFENA